MDHISLGSILSMEGIVFLKAYFRAFVENYLSEMTKNTVRRYNTLRLEAGIRVCWLFIGSI
jgi:hypothetical protein